MGKSYRPETLKEEQDIINSYLYEGSQTYTSEKHKITRRVLKEILLKHKIPLRSQPESLKGKQIGENNPNWKGGSADEHLRKLHGGYWKTALALWSELVKYSDNHICRKCGQDGSDAHHIISIKNIFRQSLNLDLIWDLNNGIYLCKVCHMKCHMNEKIFQETFQELIKNRLNSVETLQPIITLAVRKYRAKWLAKSQPKV